MQKNLHIGIKDVVLYAMVSLCMIRLFVPYVEWPYMAVCLLLAAISIYCIKNTAARINIIDIFVIIVFLYELSMISSSINLCTAPVYIMMSVVALSAYVICRLCLTSIRRLKSVLRYMVAFEFVILLVGLVAWTGFREQVYVSGFGSLYEFRSRFTPWGCIVNLWGAFLIASVGNILLAYLYCRNNRKYLASLTVVFALLVWSGMGTFSRTVYVLYAMLLFILIVLTVASGRKYRFSWLLGAYIVTVAVFCFTDRAGDVAKVVRMYDTVSQQRSVGGRIDAFAAVDDILNDRVITGVGSGNYTLAANDFLYENDDSAFTNYASSGYLQLFVEKGIIGVIIYGCQILSVLLLLLRGLFRHKRLDALISVSSMILLAGKEMTFAVIEDFPGIQVLYIIPIIGVLNIMPGRRSGFISVRTKNVYSTAVLTVISIVVFLEKSGEKTPDFIQRGCESGAEYIRLGNDSDLSNAISSFGQTMTLNQYDNVQRYNMAVLYLQSGHFYKASGILDSLIRRCPENALYRTVNAKMEMMLGDTLAGVREYAAAIILDPRITDDLEWEDMKKDRICLYKAIKAKVFGFAADNATYRQDPIKSAKLGKLMLEFGCSDKAESCLRNALEMLPNLGRAWYNLGLVLLQRQESVEAEQCFRKASFLLPGDETIKEYLHTGDPDVLQKEKEYGCFIKARSAEYSRKFRTWYRRDTDDILILSAGLF